MALRQCWQRFQKLSAFRRVVILFLPAICLIWILLNLFFPLKPFPTYSQVLLDNQKNPLYIKLTPDEKWRLYLDPKDITPLMEKTILAKEDRWFYYHPGVNPLAIIRAGARNIFTGRRTSGASTISMQVARLLEPKKRNFIGKIVECFRATQLEWQLSKKEILRLYLNLAPYGGNIEGIASASFFYLDKSPDHLSLAEITALSVIPNRPNSLTPGKHNERIIQERNRWLAWMAAKKFFTTQQIEDALKEPFEATRQPPTRVAPHLANKLLTNVTFEVQSTLERNTQQMAEKLTYDYVHSLKLQGIRNAAVVVVNNTSREVVAYVGSADFFDTTDAGQVNGAKAWRQPGSTLKPLVYGLAFDAGWVTPKKMIADVPVNFQGYVPENYDLNFAGMVTVEQALMQSLNIPAVNMLQQVGKNKMVSTLVQAGFEQIRRDQQKLGLSLILGGCGTNLEELTGLYCAIAKNGIYQPLVYKKNDTSPLPIRIVTEESCFMLHDILSKIDRPDLPLNWSATENLPRIAWKTGTSYGRRDAWSIGYNKSYTIGVWVGNFSGASNQALSGAAIATPLLFRLFNAIDRQSHTDWYEPPANMEQRIVCAETGMPANHFCEQRILDYFIPLVSDMTLCNNRMEVMVNHNQTLSYCVHCAPSGGFTKKWFTVLPPDVQAFKMNTGFHNARIPPHNPLCTVVWAEKGPTIQSPKHNGEYLLSRQHPEPLMLQCNPGADVMMVHWYLNNKHYKSAPAREKVFFMPQEGNIKISCTDDKGRNRDIRIQVTYLDM